MRNYLFKSNGYTFKRVTKKEARGYFRAGFKVVFCPVNLRPFTPWHCEIDVNPVNCDGYSFNDVVNRFEWYNCTNTETGKYTAFYIPVAHYDKHGRRHEYNPLYNNSYDRDYMTI